MNTVVKSMGSLRLFYRQSYLFRLSNTYHFKRKITVLASPEINNFGCTNRTDYKELNISCWKFQQKSLLSHIHGRIVALNHPYHLIARNSLYQSSLRLEAAKSSGEKDNVPVDPQDPDIKKLGLVQRYKKMLKEYWYVLIPVHLVTSSMWFGSFYYLAKSGIDIVPFLEALGVGDVFLEPLKNSRLGYIAVASAMYKLATPARYMVTLGGTTFSVKYLAKRGLIKPMPSSKEIKTMIQQRRHRS